MSRIVKQSLKDSYGGRFFPDGGMLLVRGRYLTAFRLPELERVYRVRPLPEAEGFAIQPAGSLVLAANLRGQFALLDGRSGETLAVCGDKGYTQNLPFALSACGKFAIDGRGEQLRVIEIATNRVEWERRFDGAIVNGIHPIDDGGRWAVHVHVLPKEGESWPAPAFVELWDWPFGGEPRGVLRSRLLATREVIVSRGGCVAMSGVASPGKSAIHAYGSGGDRLLLEREAHHMDHLLAWLDEERFAYASTEGADIVNAVSGAFERSVKLPGYSLYGCSFGPLGTDIAVHYPHGLVYAHDLFADGRAVERIEDPWAATRADSAPRHEAGDVWYRMEPAAPSRSVAARSGAELAAALADFRRPAWTPVLAPEDGPVTASKLGGTPHLAEPGSWPRCGLCGDALELFLQLNAADLPEEAGPLFDGLLQVFCCTRQECTPREPFSPATLARLASGAGPAAYAAPPSADAFMGQRIVGWQRRDDLPCMDELELLGVQLDERERSFALDGSYSFPAGGDKLLGWPSWPQNVDYVKCPACGERMRVIVQIGSELGVPHLFGDGGTAWVARCEQHASVLAFYCAW